jgi:hypothetical protein
VPTSLQDPYGSWTTTYSITTTSNTVTWSNWVGLNNGTATTISYDPWAGWVTGQTTGGLQIESTVAVAYTSETAEARAAREERYRVQTEQWRLESEKRKAEEAEASARARELLLDHLTDEERAQFEAHEYFELKTDLHTYRIRRGKTALVVDEQGRELESLCIHPREAVPPEDTMLGQKLLLMESEAEFRRIANITTIRRAAA